MADTRYSNAQRIGFGCLVMGFLMCAVGGIAPYWQVGDLSVNKFSKIFDVKIPFGDYKFVKVHTGLWWWCVEVDIPAIEKDSGCQAYTHDELKEKDYVTRGLVLINVVLALLCSLVALCRQCCCGGGKTICHGLMAFLSGAAGFVAVGIFATSHDDGFVVQNGWAFYIYTVGVSLITLMSFLLCFASPNNPLSPMIIQHLPTSIQTSVQSSMQSHAGFQRLADDQVQMNQPNDFPQVQIHNGY